MSAKIKVKSTYRAQLAFGTLRLHPGENKVDPGVWEHAKKTTALPDFLRRKVVVEEKPVKAVEAAPEPAPPTPPPADPPPTPEPTPVADPPEADAGEEATVTTPEPDPEPEDSGDAEPEEEDADQPRPTGRWSHERLDQLAADNGLEFPEGMDKKGEKAKFLRRELGL